MKWIVMGMLVLAVMITAYEHYKCKKIMDGLSAMLQAAMDGSFEERTFDESRLSSLENDFARYLQSSELAVRRIDKDKNTVNTLIADISHQTKTPISNILLYSELLEELNLPQEAAGYVRSMHVQTEKLNFLIASLVKLSRLENGIITLHPKPTRLSFLLHNIVTAVEGKAAEKGLHIRCENNVERMVLMDQKWTEEALCNILDNAVKYTIKGTVTIRVKVYEMFCCIEVCDTGVGIAEEEIPRIFSRFYRGADHHDVDGVGIGLYLAREIISGQGGYIKVTSELSKGSIFAVFLPWAEM